jgi:thiamine-phosphate pyrophosphorylase
MQLILISPEQALPQEQQHLTQMFALGLERFHLRKPHWTVAQLAAYLAHIPAEYYPRIVLHSHDALTQYFALRGIHARSDRDRRSKGFVSTGCHSFEEVRSFDSQGFEYLMLSPVFDSISKEGYPAGFAHQDLRHFLAQPRQTPLLALGGVNAQNIAQCAALGFDGVAVLGAVWQSPNPLKALLDLYQGSQDLRIHRI